MKLASVFLAVCLALLSAEGLAQSRAATPQGPVQKLGSTPQVTPVAAPSATSAPQVTPAPAISAGSAEELLIGNGDLLEISLYGMPDFKAEVRVDSAGEISLPLLGMVGVGGLTIPRAERLIERKLVEKRLFNDPHITVFEKEYSNQGISVLGEVQKPGIYPLLGSRKLEDALSAAGGTTPKSGEYALITHRNGPQHPVRVALSNGSLELAQNNVPIQPGDTVYVTKAGVVYVVGDVRQPGGFVMENGKNLTVLEAIAYAQGTNPNAALNSAKVIRRTTEGPKDIPLPLKKILAAKAPDMPLQAEDIVFVPASAGKSAAKRGAEAIVQMATGVAVWRLP